MSTTGKVYLLAILFEEGLGNLSPHFTLWRTDHIHIHKFVASVIFSLGIKAVTSRIENKHTDLYRR